MPRLIDALRADGRVLMPHWIADDKRQAWMDYARHLAQLASNPALPVLLIDNVANYFYKGTDQEHWSLDKDFPNIAPPFPAFWLEWRLVQKIHSEVGDVDISQWLPRGGRVGQLFYALDPTECKGEGIPENARWIYWCDMWIDYSRPGVTADGPLERTFICVDAEGRSIGNPWMQSYGNEEVARADEKHHGLVQPGAARDLVSALQERAGRRSRRRPEACQAVSRAARRRRADALEDADYRTAQGDPARRGSRA